MLFEARLLSSSVLKSSPVSRFLRLKSNSKAFSLSSLPFSFTPHVSLLSSAPSQSLPSFQSYSRPLSSLSSSKSFHMSTASESSSISLNKPSETSSFFASQREIQSSEWQKVGPGFWSLHTSLSFALGMIDVGTQMSLIEVKPDEFLVLSTVKLTPSALKTLKDTTDDGKKIVAAIGTHPFHTLFFVDFNKEFPSVPLYGTARHKRMLPDLPWQEESVSASSSLLKRWENDGVFMRVADGAPFDDPEEGNHFSGLFVYHHPSRTLHIDDTILYFPHGGLEGAERKSCSCSSDSSVASPKEEEENKETLLPPITNPPMCLALRFIKKKGSFEFWDLKKGLNKSEGSAAQFRAFMENLLADFPFQSLAAAHVGIKQGGAHRMVQDLLKSSLPEFEKLDARFVKKASSNEKKFESKDSEKKQEENATDDKENKPAEEQK